jgi:hypothetical protein
MRMRFVDPLHPARAILNEQMQETLQRLDEVEQLISPPRRKPAFVSQIELPPRPAEAALAESSIALEVGAALPDVAPERAPVEEAPARPPPVPQKPSQESLTQERPAEDNVVIRMRSAGIAGPHLHAKEPRRRSPRNVRTPLAAMLGNARRGATDFLARLLDFVAVRVGLAVYVFLRALYSFRRVSAQARHALSSRTIRTLTAIRHALASRAGSLTRFAHATTVRARYAIRTSAHAAAATTASLASPFQRAFTLAGGVAGRASRALRNRISRATPAIESGARRLAAYGARHAADLANYSASTFRQASSRIRTATRSARLAMSRYCFHMLPRATSRLAQRIADLTARTWRALRRRASALLETAAAHLFIWLVLIICHVAPVAIATPKFVLQTARSATRYVSSWLARTTPIIVSHARALPAKLQRTLRRFAGISVRISTAFADRARPALRATARRASDLSWALAFHAGVRLLLFAGHARVFLKATAAGARQLVKAAPPHARALLAASRHAAHRLTPAIVDIRERALRIASAGGRHIFHLLFTRAPRERSDTPARLPAPRISPET